MIQLKMTINGKSFNGESSSFSVINPATEQSICECPAASAEQVDVAVSSARHAFKTWKQTTLAQRCELLGQCAQIIDNHCQELAELLTREQGKPLADALGEV